MQHSMLRSMVFCPSVFSLFMLARFGSGSVAGAAWRSCPGSSASSPSFPAFQTHSVAFVSRGDATLAEREKVADARNADWAELERLQAALAALPPFVPADQAALDSARAAAKAASEQRAAECRNGDPAQRGKNCRAREADERAALDRLAEVSINKAMTDRAAALEAQIAEVRARLSASESVHSPNPFQAALVNLFGPSGAKLATWQAVVVAGVFELCLVFCAVMFETLGHSGASSSRRPGASKSRSRTPIAPMSQRAQPRRSAQRRSAHLPSRSPASVRQTEFRSEPRMRQCTYSMFD